MAILSIMVVNNHGQARLLKFYKDVPHQQRETVVREAFQLVSKRPDNVCNFLEGTEVSDEAAEEGTADHGQQTGRQEERVLTTRMRASISSLAFSLPVLCVSPFSTGARTFV